MLWIIMTYECMRCTFKHHAPFAICSMCNLQQTDKPRHELAATVLPLTLTPSIHRVRFANTLTVDNPYDNDPDTNEIFTITRSTLGVQQDTNLRVVRDRDDIWSWSDGTDNTNESHHISSVASLPTSKKEATANQRFGSMQGSKHTESTINVHSSENHNQENTQVKPTQQYDNAASESIVEHSNTNSNKDIDVETKSIHDNNNIGSDPTETTATVVFPLQIGPKSDKQAKMTDFFKAKNDTTLSSLVTPPRPTKRNKQCQHEDDDDDDEKKPAAVPSVVNGERESSDASVTAYVKSIPLCDRERAVVYSPIRLSLFDSGNLPTGVTLVNDWDGPDPNRLLLVVDENVDEIPDIILDASWQGMNDYVSGNMCEKILFQDMQKEQDNQ